MEFAALRQEVWWTNTQLPANRLVVMHSGNASGIDREAGLVLIKPSGVDYGRLRPEDLAVITLDGETAQAEAVPDGVTTNLRPSVDTAHHLALYRGDPTIGGVIHTHSNFATAWAAAGLPIPCALTAMADEFGGEIPVGPFALIGDDSIGRGIVATLDEHRSPAVLMQNHGVFTVGPDARAAVKAAVMCEDVARTVHIARQLGEPLPIEPADVDRLYERYQNVYGQRSH